MGRNIVGRMKLLLKLLLTSVLRSLCYWTLLDVAAPLVAASQCTSLLPPDCAPLRVRPQAVEPVIHGCRYLDGAVLWAEPALNLEWHSPVSSGSSTAVIALCNRIGDIRVAAGASLVVQNLQLDQAVWPNWQLVESGLAAPAPLAFQVASTGNASLLFDACSLTTDSCDNLVLFTVVLKELATRQGAIYSSDAQGTWIHVQQLTWGPVNIFNTNISCDPAQPRTGRLALATAEGPDQLLLAMQVLGQLQPSIISLAFDMRLPADTWPANLTISQPMVLAGQPTPAPRTILDLHRVRLWCSLVGNATLTLQNLQLQNMCVMKLFVSQAVATLSFLSAESLWPVNYDRRRLGLILQNVTLISQPSERQLVYTALLAGTYGRSDVFPRYLASGAEARQRGYSTGYSQVNASSATLLRLVDASRIRSNYTAALQSPNAAADLQPPDFCTPPVNSSSVTAPFIHLVDSTAGLAQSLQQLVDSQADLWAVRMTDIGLPYTFILLQNMSLASALGQQQQRLANSSSQEGVLPTATTVTTTATTSSPLSLGPISVLLSGPLAPRVIGEALPAVALDLAGCRACLQLPGAGGSSSGSSTHAYIGNLLLSGLEECGANELLGSSGAGADGSSTDISTPRPWASALALCAFGFGRQALAEPRLHLVNTTLVMRAEWFAEALLVAAKLQGLGMQRAGSSLGLAGMDALQVAQANPRFIILDYYAAWGVKGSNITLQPGRDDLMLSPTPSANNGLMAGQVAGIVAGAVGGLLAVVATVLVVGLLRRGSGAKPDAGDEEHGKAGAGGPQAGGARPDDVAPQQHQQPGGRALDSFDLAPSRGLMLMNGRSNNAVDQPNPGGSTGAVTEDSGKVSTCPIEEVRQLAQGLGSTMRKLTLGQKIGQGAFGSVYKGSWCNMDVAIKTMLFASDAQPGSREALMRQLALQEAAVCISLSHPNVVLTYHYEVVQVQQQQELYTVDSFVVSEQAEPDHKLYLIQELCDMSLADLAMGPAKSELYKCEGLPCLPTLLPLLMDVARGMAYLHKLNIVHGDLTLKNIMIKSASGPDGSTAWQCKIADFGLSALLSPDKTHMSNMHRGTPYFVAPETEGDGQMTKGSDVFSFGVLMWCLLCGSSPSRSVGRALLPHQDYLCFPNTAPPRYCRLAQSCLQREPGARPSFEAILGELGAMAGAGVTGGQQQQRCQQLVQLEHQGACDPHHQQKLEEEQPQQQQQQQASSGIRPPSQTPECTPCSGAPLGMNAADAQACSSAAGSSTCASQAPAGAPSILPPTPPISTPTMSVGLPFLDGTSSNLPLVCLKHSASGWRLGAETSGPGRPSILIDSPSLP